MSVLSAKQAIENAQSFYNFVKTTGYKATPFWSTINDLDFKGDPNLGQSWFYRKRKSIVRTHSHLEGGAAVAANAHLANKLQNEMQIFKDTYGVTGSQDAAVTIDNTASLLTQSELCMADLRKDIEAAFMGSQAPIANTDDSTARKMGGIGHYMVNEIDANGAELSWDLLEDLLQGCWSNGVEVSHLMSGSLQKRKLNAILNAMAGRQTSSKDKASGGQNFTTIQESAFAPDIGIQLTPYATNNEIIVYDPKIIHSVLHRAIKGRELIDSDDDEKREHLFELSLQIDDPYAITRIKNLKTI